MSDDRVINIAHKLTCLKFISEPGKDTKAEIIALGDAAKSGDPGARLKILLRSINNYRGSGKMLETEKAELTELEEMIDAALKLEAAGDYKALAGEMIFIGYHWGFFEVADGWHTNLARNFGTMKPRKPDITEWIAKTILAHPNLTRPELYDLAPDWITDQLTLEPFKKRVSRVRKKNKK